MSDTPHMCEQCSQPAKTCILRGYDAGRPVFERLCFDCADRAVDAPLAFRRDRPTGGTLLLTTGLLLALLVGSVDFLGPTGTGGLGWLQISGLILALATLICGALLSIGPLIIIGAVALLLAAGADLLSLGGSEGIGWKQQSGLLLAAILCYWGLRQHRIGRAQQLAAEQVQH